MLRRKFTQRLIEWKERKTTQALLVMGARQVGKTYGIESFARERYSHVITFDLVEQEDVLEALEGVRNATDLFMVLSAYATEPFVPHETLVFIDEIQECKRALTLIKYLVKREEFDYILSGSLLGVELRDVRSLPVGYLDICEVYPLDFEEFCWANGVGTEAWGAMVEAYETRKPLLEGIHQRFLSLFHQYLFVGGMPRVVEEFVDRHDVGRMKAVQDNILALYRMDVAKYAADGSLLIKEAFDLIPSQLDTQSKRFALSALKKGGTYDTLAAHFLWLVDAGVALKVDTVREPRHPLRLSEDRGYFKLFMNDVGLLSAACGMEVVKSVLSDKLGVNFGSIYENVVAQELAAHGFDLFYYRNKGIGELDFVIEQPGGRVLPIEVKSGKTYKRHSALSRALSAPNYQIDGAVVLCEDNVSQEGKVSYLPAYMVSMLERA